MSCLTGGGAGYAVAMRGPLLVLWLGTCAALAATASEHGSLVVGVPVRSGWVVCSDKRIVSPIRGVRDDETKIVQLRPGLVFGVTGLQRVVESVDGQIVVRFSVADVVRAHLDTHAFAGTSDDLRALGDALVAAISEYAARAPGAGLPAADDPDGAGVSVAVFWVDRSRPNVAMLRVSARQPFSAEISMSSAQTGGPPPRPVGMGNTAVWLEVERGKRPEFADARYELAQRGPLHFEAVYQSTSRGEAERFARRMIATTSEMNPVLGLTPSNVGPTADCLQVQR